MKNIWLIISISLLLGIVSCSEDDDKTLYTVLFEADGGHPCPSTQKVEAGGTILPPVTNPTKTGYVFMFWHVSEASTAYNFQTPVNRDITLQARWQEEATAEYWQVTWNLNGGSWPPGDNHATQVLKGGTLVEPAGPTKSGYTFEGWYKEEGLTYKISFPYDVSSVTGDFTLYAKWSNAATEYWEITWELNGGVWPATADNHVSKIEKGTTLAEPNAPTKAGNSFEGWYKEAALTNKLAFPATVTSHLKLYAKWKEGVVNTPAVGDYYYSDGTFSGTLNKTKTCIGLVFRAKTATESGLVVSHNERDRSGWWAPITPTGYIHKQTNADDRNDGAYNLMMIKKWNSWEKWWPAFSWCTDKGEGWYLPAINELITLCQVVMGDVELNERLEAIPEGVSMQKPHYWSSTENSLSSALTYTPLLNSTVSRDKTFAKTSNVSVRAVFAF